MQKMPRYLLIYYKISFEEIYIEYKKTNNIIQGVKIL